MLQSATGEPCGGEHVEADPPAVEANASQEGHSNVPWKPKFVYQAYGRVLKPCSSHGFLA